MSSITKNHKPTLLAIFVTCLLVLSSLGIAHAQGESPFGSDAILGSAFTYQGQLKDDAGNPLNATCDFVFRLWDAAGTDTQIGADSAAAGVIVTGGYFTAQVNAAGEFGASAFTGEARWLGVSVRCPSGSGEYTTLAPRQPLTVAPYASYALQAPWGGLTGVPAGFADGTDNDTTYTSGSGLTLSGGAFSVSFAGSGSATTVSRSDHTHTTFWRITGNSQTDPATNFIGTTDNQPLVFRVNDLQALRIEPHATSPNIIGGYSGNSVTAGVYGATISGGGQSGSINQVTANYGTVSGGHHNTAGGQYATVGGGYNNTTDNSTTTIGGGEFNQATGNGATVGGGTGNLGDGDVSTICGGASNFTSGAYATACGGGLNTAAGDFSFVAGSRASNDDASHDGVFLFADSTYADFLSTAANEFAVRASGGVRLRTSSDLSTGCNLAAGSGTWACTSDRNAKANFAFVDSRAILVQVAALPITTWNFKTQDASIQHIGPMAQDFYAAFGTGESDTTISMVDADGVALAAIQGLNEIVEEKEEQISALETRLAALEQTQAGSPASSAWLPMLMAISALLLLGIGGLLGILVAPRIHWRKTQ